ncbi:MAG: hypothetical protein ACRDHU_07535 [Actinomycetota bacterium]
MRRERRKNRFLRRLVLGLAVAASVAPAAQARLDSGAEAQGNAAEPAAVIRGDDKVIAPTTDGQSSLINGDDKVIAPKPVYYTVAGLPRALQDDGNRTEAPVEAVRSPGSFDWGDALVGAGVAFGMMLLLGGAVLATRHVRPAAA